MNFLVDAQLPRRIAHRLREFGYDVVHTLNLPNGNRTADDEINSLAALSFTVSTVWKDSAIRGGATLRPSLSYLPSQISSVMDGSCIERAERVDSWEA